MESKTFSGLKISECYKIHCFCSTILDQKKGSVIEKESLSMAVEPNQLFAAFKLNNAVELHVYMLFVFASKTQGL